MASHWILAILVKVVSKMYLSRRNRGWYILVVRPISIPVLESFLFSLIGFWSQFLPFYVILGFWLTKCLNRAQKMDLKFWTSFTKMARNRWDALFSNAHFAQYVDNSPDYLLGKFHQSRSSLSVLEILDKMWFLRTYLGNLELSWYSFSEKS